MEIAFSHGVRGEALGRNVVMIATDGGRLYRLSATEIDALCERLNCR